MKSLFIIFGSQLFPTKHLNSFKDTPIYMAEDYGLCTYYKFHKHKIIYFLSSMRNYADELKEKGFKVQYIKIDKITKKDTYEKNLSAYITKNKIQKLYFYEIEDKFMEEKMEKLCHKLKIEYQYIQSPMFLTSRSDFKKYLSDVKKPFMKTFYERERKKQNIMMEAGKPQGGKFSYDSENRKKLPKNTTIPHYDLFLDYDKNTKAVIKIVDEKFKNHPGNSTHFWVPVTRKQALNNLNSFFKDRFHLYGTYQDAIEPEEVFLFHSIISPSLNIGHITPDEVINKAINYAKKNKIPLNSLEGFVRQVMGWREFLRGIYQNFDHIQQKENFWNHKRKLSKDWYKGTTGIPVLDDSIKKTDKFGYAHHIERLMVLSNLMLLCEIHPQEVYKWFMEMFVDSSDWVMGPNVFGMGQFSDGGIFATKPYISGSNYILKMSSYKKGDWCDIWDGLYWRFIDKNVDFYKSNPRMGMMVNLLKKMDKKRKADIFKKAEEFIQRVTV